MKHDIRGSTHWEKQAPAPDPRDVVNYAGNVASGLRFESSTGQTIALYPQSLTDLFDTLRRHNPLWDGGADDVGDSVADRLQQWFADKVAAEWQITDTATESARLHRVLRAEGLELPHIRPFDAVQAVVSHDVIFFDRRNVCLARLVSVERDDASDNDIDSPVRFEFDVIPLPELEWTHGSPFTIGASEDFIQLRPGTLRHLDDQRLRHHRTRADRRRPSHPGRHSIHAGNPHPADPRPPRTTRSGSRSTLTEPHAGRRAPYPSPPVTPHRTLRRSTSGLHRDIRLDQAVTTMPQTVMPQRNQLDHARARAPTRVTVDSPGSVPAQHGRNAAPTLTSPRYA